MAGTALLFIFIGVQPNEPSATRLKSINSTNQTISLYQETKDWVKERLKSPSTTEFPGPSEFGKQIQISGNIWTVKSYVDSQNSFGASLRTKYTAVVEKAGDKWRLKSMQIDN